MDLAREFITGSVSGASGTRFNPCFNGSCSRIPYRAIYQEPVKHVSILVLMDLAREFYNFRHCCIWIYVSILVLMDLARESTEYFRITTKAKKFQSLF